MFQVQVEIPGKKPMILAKSSDLTRVEKSYREIVQTYPQSIVSLCEKVGKAIIIYKINKI